MPDITKLINPAFTIEYRYFDANGIRLNNKGKIYCSDDDSKLTFSPCGVKTAKASDIVYKTDPDIVPENCSEIRYELREEK